MSESALPVSVSITHEQLAWLDARRRHGSLSRSAVLRQVLDSVIRRETLAAAEHGPARGDVVFSQGW